MQTVAVIARVIFVKNKNIKGINGNNDVVKNIRRVAHLVYLLSPALVLKHTNWFPVDVQVTIVVLEYSTGITNIDFEEISLAICVNEK